MPFENRLRKARQLLNDLEIESVIVTSPANFFYFSGVWLDSNERLQAIVISKNSEETHMIIPEMSIEEVANARHFTKHFWEDGENALEIVSSLLSTKGQVSVDNLWSSSYLIELMNMKPSVEFVPSTHTLGNLRLFKDAHEIAKLKESGRIADEVMEEVIELIEPGLTESKIADEVKRLFAKKGVNELSFNAIVGSGKHGAIPHHTPDETEVKNGDMIVLDLGGIKDHYCSDITRTIVIGEPTEEMKKVYEIVQRAQEAAFQAVKPGIPFKEIDGTARNIIAEAGYGDYFTHRTGHGLGIQVHEEPYVTPVNDQLLEEGMVISIEPGIYLEGKFGVRIEDIVVVTSQGGNRLNEVTLDLLIKK